MDGFFIAYFLKGATFQEIIVQTLKWTPKFGQ
jgi:hypothetical protein